MTKQEELKAKSRFFKADYPLYAASLLHDGSLILAGGGGSSKTGVPNGAELFTYSGGENVSDKQQASQKNSTEDSTANHFTHSFHFSSETKAIMNSDSHPTKPLLVVGMDEECRLFEVNTKDKAFKQVASVISDFRKEEPYQKVCRFSASGNLLITGGTDSKARVWEIPSLKLLFTLEGHTGELKDADISPDESQAVTVAEDKTVNIWDLKTGKIQHSLKADTRWDRKKNYRTQACRFATIEDEVFLITAHSLPKHPSRLVKWSTSTWTPVGYPIIPIRDVPLTVMTLSKNNQYIGVADAEGSVAVVDTHSFNITAKVDHLHELFVTGLVFSPDSSKLISISADRYCCSTPSVLYHRRWSVVPILVLLIIVLFLILALYAVSQQ